MSYLRLRTVGRALLVGTGCALCAALVPITFAAEPQARAAQPIEVALAGHALAQSTTLTADAERFVRAYLEGSIRLRAGERVLELRRAALGIRVDAAHLTSLLESARDAGSPMRRLHDRVLAGRPIAIELPASIDHERVQRELITLWDELARAPVEAHVDPRKRTLVNAKPGAALDLHAAVERIERAVRSGLAEVELPLLQVPAARPDKRLDAIAMNAVLGELSTRYNQAEVAADRTHNLEVAASRIDGYVLEPGEVLDFNAVVGDRTGLYGFKAAPVIADGELRDGVGGGTCQVASTLYAAAYFAGLPILERSPHSRPSYYTKLGLDAAVAYGSLNLRFQNDYPFPIVLEMTLEHGVLRAAVHGKERTRRVSFLRRIDETIPFTERVIDDPELPSGTRVLVQRGIPGFVLTHFRAVVDGTHNTAHREQRSDRYPPTEQLWRVGSGPAADADFVPPKNDAHPEYVADAFLIATQGPGIEGTQTERQEGKSGVYGWTEREGMRIPAVP